jgi:radical SAM-linked protein
MARALKKSGLPVWYSQGFNPHIYMTFTLPLSLGHESECESVDFRLNEEMAEADILKALEGTLPQGIELVSAQAPDYDARSIMFAKYDITLYGEKADILSALEKYDALEQAIVTKVTKKGQKDINLKELIKDITVIDEKADEVTFTAIYPAGTPLNINPQLLLDFIKDNYGVEVIDAFVIRKNLFDKDLNILQ